MSRPPSLPSPALASPDARDGVRRSLLAWFDASGRPIPFRSARGGYAVLVAEVMAQQTQVTRAGIAWSEFMRRFPTVDALASASPGDVLRAWGGLGYNRRAINLQRAARIVASEYRGVLPAEVSLLEALPGIGPYTARAVAAIAFGVPVAGVDTNVRRVLGRVLVGHGAPTDPRRPLPPLRLQSAADGLVDPARPGDWTHAVMDVGSTLCRARTPACDRCPLLDWCVYARSRPVDGPGGVAVAPRRSAARVTPRRGSHRVSGRAGAVAFESTRRWLRGRLVARLRPLAPGAWIRVEPPVGRHGREAVRAALDALVAEGLVERDADGRVRLPV